MSKTFKIEVVETIRHFYTFIGDKDDTPEIVEEKFWAQVDKLGELPESEDQSSYDKLVTIVSEEILQ